jgi:hypothetical protein
MYIRLDQIHQIRLLRELRISPLRTPLLRMLRTPPPRQILPRLSLNIMTLWCFHQMLQM